jgi:hypothetical protein
LAGLKVIALKEKPLVWVVEKVRKAKGIALVVAARMMVFFAVGAMEIAALTTH